MKLDAKTAEQILLLAASITENTENRGDFKVVGFTGDHRTMADGLRCWAAWISRHGFEESSD